MNYPYFRFATYGNRKDLFAWEEHFQNLDIPFAVTAKGNGHFTEFSIWRIGVEHHAPDAKIEPNTEPLTDMIISSWGDFKMEGI